MTIAARYQPGAIRSPFVDRAELLEEFDRALAGIGQAPTLLELTGVGGIGKSRLLHELAKRVPADLPTARLNLQEPSQRSALAALGSLRAQFGAAGVGFDRFDLAYGIWWQRLNPQVTLSRDQVSWLSESEILTSILDEASGLPVFGIAVKALDIAARKFKRWNLIRHDPTLMELTELTLDQLGDAVVYLFARDLDAHGGYLLCVDAYEALVGGVERAGTAALADVWLRDLLGQLDRGLVVVATREPLGWERRDPRWSERIRPLPVAALPYDARLELLAALGVTDPEAGASIARDCEGLPFYLHLAHESGPAASRYAHIEERFLHHVEPDIVRVFELLSVARVFDREIFRRMARHYELRADTQMWERLIAYSFIATAGENTLQMHQLMARSIQARLSPGVLREIHELLRDIWYERGVATRMQEAWREAAHHAACAAPDDLPSLLPYADRLAALGKPGLDAMCADLHEMAAKVAPRTPWQRLTRLLTAEAALLVGDAETAHAELSAIGLTDDADDIDARLSLAAANALRIRGDTAQALRQYALLWPGYGGQVRLDAGLWHADLDMAQGRFIDAIATAEAVAEASSPEQVALRGDLARLRCLAYRFAFEPAAAMEQLAVARALYETAGHEVGLANILTNEAEVLALADSAAAVPVAVAALAAQRRLGAEHEIGKSLSALALAQLGLGELDAAGAALDEAAAVLERCGYRSGRARAELIRALWHARAGRFDQAQLSAVWAVTELDTVQVYPTLIMVAGALLDRIGAPERTVTAAVERSVAALQPLHGLDPLRTAIRDLVRRLLHDEWDDVYAQARSVIDGSAGFYNTNVRVGAHLVRVPIGGADRMDLRIWPEAAVLTTVSTHLDCVPKLRSISDEPQYQIHEWIDGPTLNDIAPRGTRLPAGMTDQFAAFFARLEDVPLLSLPPLPAGWPEDGDSAGFAAQLLDITKGVHATFAAGFAGLWTRFRIPDDPFAALTLRSLSPRPFRLVHADVHRKNVMLRDGAAVFLDWELAVGGDPLYELAVHLHKMGYLADEEDAMRAAWARACGADQWPGWESDVERYLAHERVKTAIVDSVRYAKLVAEDPSELALCTTTFTDKLTLARRVWGDPEPVDPNEVAALLMGHLR
ncbi:phosphotransferase [Dactylosporangium sp. NPDC000521]|uniref:phosphotransferase n=1 Tax=Dactylosporangium sp. NPDC000521 TaxID=3363975 RepID=UPI0036C4751F